MMGKLLAMWARSISAQSHSEISFKCFNVVIHFLFPHCYLSFLVKTTLSQNSFSLRLNGS